MSGGEIQLALQKLNVLGRVLYIAAHPDDAAKLIAPKGTPDDQRAIAELIRANDRLGMNVQRASDVLKEINSVYAAGKSIAFLPSDPAASTIYQAPGQ